jgi:hypothetical protein
MADDRATGMPGGSPTAAAGTPASNSCPHQMTGTVKQLDKTTGTVAIDVAGANSIEIHLPPNELAGFQEGDQVVVSMGLRESRAGTTAPSGRDPREFDPDRPVGTPRDMGGTPPAPR